MLNFGRSRKLVFLPLVMAATGCGIGLGTLGTIGSLTELVRSYRGAGAAPQPVQVVAEVQRIEPRRQTLQVETPDGRAGAVIYDLGTQVVYQHEPYAINALGSGDVVNLHLEEVERNTLYASRIEVVQLAEEEETAEAAPAETRARTPEDTARVPAVEELEGVVGTVEYERGRFELRAAEDRVVAVSLPYNPPEAVLERFRALRPGETVRVVGERLGTTRFELQRFR